MRLLKLLCWVLLFTLPAISSFAAAKRQDDDSAAVVKEDTAHRAENPLLGYTHLLPSPFTIPGGRLVLGTSIGLGLTDFFQVSTDVIHDFYKVYNASAKVAVLDFQEFALALTLGYVNYDLHDIDPTNPPTSVTSWQPGFVAAYEPIEHVSHAFGGNLNLTKAELENIPGLRTSGYVTGVTVENDISWAYNPKKRHVGNVLSAGVTYDFTYKIYGIGMSHHWPGFHVGIHYYPNATKYRVQPILVGGAVVDL